MHKAVNGNSHTRRVNDSSAVYENSCQARESRTQKDPGPCCERDILYHRFHRLVSLLPPGFFEPQYLKSLSCSSTW